MRTPLVACALAALGASAGCSDLTAGQPDDPSGPPRLVRLTVQDVRGLAGAPSPTVGFVQRNSVVDLIDDTPLAACSDIQPCIQQYNIDFTTPDFSCNVSAAGGAGLCNDPLKVPSRGVPISVPLLPASGDAGSGMQIRIVFNKVLDNSIETVAVDPTQPPGKTEHFALKDGLVSLVDAAGMEVPSVKIYDNGGSPEFTSDLLLAPFGPAIVIKPKDPLAPATKYTVKLLAPSQLQDRDGHAAADANGAALPAGFSVSFTTEPLTDNPAGSFPDFTTTPTEITPNQILQLAFWSPVDETTATATVTGPGGAVQVALFNDRGAKPAACADALNPWLLDLVHTSGSGAAEAPVEWPAGDYTLTFTVKDAVTGGSTFTSDTLTFTVGGAADPMDPNGFGSHVLPAQCTP